MYESGKRAANPAYSSLTTSSSLTLLRLRYSDEAVVLTAKLSVDEGGQCKKGRFYNAALLSLLFPDGLDPIKEK